MLGIVGDPQLLHFRLNVRAGGGFGHRTCVAGCIRTPSGVGSPQLVSEHGYPDNHNISIYSLCSIKHPTEHMRYHFPLSFEFLSFLGISPFVPLPFQVFTSILSFSLLLFRELIPSSFRHHLMIIPSSRYHSIFPVSSHLPDIYIHLNL